MSKIRKRIQTYFPFFFLLLMIGYLLYDSTSIKELENPKNQVRKKGVEIYYIDVGQADSTLIQCDNKYVMIDAGNNKDGNKLVKYLNEIGVEKIAYLIATHPHEDHIGGMDNIIKNFEIENYYKTEDELSIMTYTEIMKALEEKNIVYHIPKKGEKFQIGECNFKIIYIEKDKEDLNDTSMVIRLEYGNTSFLFTADATNQVESEILYSKENIKSDVLKVAHHGSSHSNSIEFLNEVNPKYAIIFVGNNNDYHYPHQSTLNKLEKLNTKIYRTDIDGTIIVKIDGEQISFKKVHTDTNNEENENARKN